MLLREALCLCPSLFHPRILDSKLLASGEQPSSCTTFFYKAQKSMRCSEERQFQCAPTSLSLLKHGPFLCWTLFIEEVLQAFFLF